MQLGRYCQVDGMWKEVVCLSGRSWTWRYVPSIRFDSRYRSDRLLATPFELEGFAGSFTIRACQQRCVDMTELVILSTRQTTYTAAWSRELTSNQSCQSRNSASLTLITAAVDVVRNLK